MKKILKHFFSVINTKTFIVIIAACATTYLCTKLEFHYNVPTDLIGIAIVFPIVFSINAAYSRREKALEHYSVFKGSALSIRCSIRTVVIPSFLIMFKMDEKR